MQPETKAPLHGRHSLLSPTTSSTLQEREVVADAEMGHFEEADFMHTIGKADDRKKKKQEQQEQKNKVGGGGVHWDAVDFWEPRTLIHRNGRAQRRAQQKHRWVKWVVVVAVAIAVGLTSVVIFQTVFRLDRELVRMLNAIMSGDNVTAGEYITGYFAIVAWSCGFTSLSCLLCWISPTAAGSGIPQVMAYLNGVRFPELFTFKTFALKVLSSTAAVASQLPFGAEGPLIHIGAIVGAGLNAGRSKTFGFRGLSFMSRFRTQKDRRDFIAVGAAAGVTAAFNSPMGGMLFVLEEVATSMSIRLGTFMCWGCLWAAFTRSVFSSYVIGWELADRQGAEAGEFLDYQTLRFSDAVNISMNVSAVFPAMLLGALVGAGTCLFTMLNVQMARFRVHRIVTTQRRFIETVVIAWAYITIAYWVSAAWPCTDVPESMKGDVARLQHINETQLFRGFCHNKTQYNPMASLMIGDLDTNVRMVFTKKTDGLFPPLALALTSVLYCISAGICAGMFVSSGLLFPSLLIGGSFGRLFGILLHDLVGKSWADPGVFALTGAAAFVAGLNRLSFSIIVIVIEISGDIKHLLVIIAGVVASRLTAQFLQPMGLYRTLVALKSAPFIDDDVGAFETFSVNDIMTTPVHALRSTTRLDTLIALLQSTQHNCFPVISCHDETFRGTLSRETLTFLLRHIFSQVNAIVEQAEIGSGASSHASTARTEAAAASSPQQQQQQSRGSRKFASEEEMRGIGDCEYEYVYDSEAEAEGQLNSTRVRVNLGATVSEQIANSNNESGKKNKDGPNNNATTTTTAAAVNNNNNNENPTAGATTSDHAAEDRLQSPLAPDPPRHTCAQLCKISVPFYKKIIVPKHSYELDLLTLEQLQQYRDKSAWGELPNDSEVAEEALDILVDLNPYVDTSTLTVSEHMGIAQSHQLFRYLNYRHVVVVDRQNKVQGILTRKDLSKQAMKKKIAERKKEKLAATAAAFTTFDNDQAHQRRKRTSSGGGGGGGKIAEQEEGVVSTRRSRGVPVGDTEWFSSQSSLTSPDVVRRRQQTSPFFEPSQQQQQQQPSDQRRHRKDSRGGTAASPQSAAATAGTELVPLTVQQGGDHNSALPYGRQRTTASSIDEQQQARREGEVSDSSCSEAEFMAVSNVGAKVLLPDTIETYVYASRENSEIAVFTGQQGEMGSQMSASGASALNIPSTVRLQRRVSRDVNHQHQLVHHSSPTAATGDDGDIEEGDHSVASARRYHESPVQHAGTTRRSGQSQTTETRQRSSGKEKEDNRGEYKIQMPRRARSAATAGESKRSFAAADRQNTNEHGGVATTTTTAAAAAATHNKISVSLHSAPPNKHATDYYVDP